MHEFSSSENKLRAIKDRRFQGSILQISGLAKGAFFGKYDPEEARLL